MYWLEEVGPGAYDIFTKSDRYAGTVIEKPKGHHELAFNCSGSKRSARKFKTRQDAIEFMHQRRVKKGWRTQ